MAETFRKSCPLCGSSFETSQDRIRFCPDCRTNRNGEIKHLPEKQRRAGQFIPFICLACNGHTDPNQRQQTKFQHRVCSACRRKGYRVRICESCGREFAAYDGKRKRCNSCSGVGGNEND